MSYKVQGIYSYKTIDFEIRWPDIIPRTNVITESQIRAPVVEDKILIWIRKKSRISLKPIAIGEAAIKSMTLRTNWLG